MEKFCLFYFLAITLVTFIVYGIDKWKAQNGYWRISEKTLFLLAMFGGSIGALTAMQLFRHKTQHKSFVIGIPVILIMQVVIAIIILIK